MKQPRPRHLNRILRENFRLITIRNRHSRYLATVPLAWLRERIQEYQVMETLGREDAGRLLWQRLRDYQVNGLSPHPVEDKITWSTSDGIGELARTLNQHVTQRLTSSFCAGGIVLCASGGGIMSSASVAKRRRMIFFGFLLGVAVM
jgi:hypothetical protein